MQKTERLVAIVGVDGVGKTEVGKELARRLNQKGLAVYNTYVPVEPLASVMKRVRTRGRMMSFFGYGLAGAISARYLECQLSVYDNLVVVADRFLGDAVASHISQGVNPKLVNDFVGRLHVPTPQVYVLLECDLDKRQARILKGRGKLNASDVSHVQMDARLRLEYRRHVLSHEGFIVDTTNISIPEVVQQIVNCSGLES